MWNDQGPPSTSALTSASIRNNGLKYKKNIFLCTFKFYTCVHRNMPLSRLVSETHNINMFLLRKMAFLYITCISMTISAGVIILEKESVLLYAQVSRMLISIAKFLSQDLRKIACLMTDWFCLYGMSALSLHLQQSRITLHLL